MVGSRSASAYDAGFHPSAAVGLPQGWPMATAGMTPEMASFPGVPPGEEIQIHEGMPAGDLETTAGRAWMGPAPEPEVPPGIMKKLGLPPTIVGIPTKWVVIGAIALWFLKK